VYFDNEMKTLECLREWGVHNVPWLVQSVDAFTGSTSVKCLIVSPVGKKIYPCVKVTGSNYSASNYSNARDVVPVIAVLRTIHDKKIAHRDIKPDNMYFDSDGKILLNDWASATALNDISIGVGTAGYSNMNEASASNDLISLVKTAYTFVTSRKPPSEEYESFWNDAFIEGSLWMEIYDAARNCDYERMEILMSKL
jgi:hypothetical protein